MSPEERIADLDRSEAQARAEVERLKEDSELLDLASELLIGADFQWGDPPTPILALGPIPKPVRVGVDLREDLRRIRDSLAALRG